VEGFRPRQRKSPRGLPRRWRTPHAVIKEPHRMERGKGRGDRTDRPDKEDSRNACKSVTWERRKNAADHGKKKISLLPDGPQRKKMRLPHCKMRLAALWEKGWLLWGQSKRPQRGKKRYGNKSGQNRQVERNRFGET